MDKRKLLSAVKLFLPYLAVAVISAVVTSGIFLAIGLRTNEDLLKRYAAEPRQSGKIDPAAYRLSGGTESFVRIQESVAPAVVFIKTSKEIPVSNYINPFDFFDRFFEQEQKPIKPRTEKQTAQGSGFLIEPDGYILTNAHVVSGADEIKVILSNKKEYKAIVKGMDKLNDLALLKIDGNDLPHVKLGDSGDLQPGQWVMAIGNPFGYANTVTAGIISGLQREIQQPDIPTNLIQTDAAINYGNSGGPLINIQGEVIGINTAIIPYAQGIGFAIPINTAKDILPELREKGKVSHPWLGISMSPVTEEIADYFNVKPGQGVFVGNVIQNSPADKAGIQPQDIILEINRIKIKSIEQLQKIVGSMKVGQTVQILLIRNNTVKIFKVKIGERPGNM
ncbi:MAG: S1C family serine protease [Bacillota bacterium]